ncbi:MAG: hypothetical protein U9N63_10655 [Pseudomonadota bacterium]|nr:hypothetical protein [Pseudomonadota bacterium]
MAGNYLGRVLRQFKYLPEAFGTVWLLIYVLFKFKVVSLQLAQYRVDPYFFLFLDLITIPGYVWCSGQLVRRLLQNKFDFWTAGFGFGLLLTFVLPYAYLAFAGSTTFPLFVWLFLFVFVFFNLILVVYKFYSRCSKGRVERLAGSGGE